MIRSHDDYFEVRDYNSDSNYVFRLKTSKDENVLFYLSHRYFIRKDFIEQFKLELELDCEEDNSLTIASDFFIINKHGEKVLICAVLETSFRVLLYDLQKDPNMPRKIAQRKWYNVSHFI